MFYGRKNNWTCRAFYAFFFAVYIADSVFGNAHVKDKKKKKSENTGNHLQHSVFRVYNVSECASRVFCFLCDVHKWLLLFVLYVSLLFRCRVFDEPTCVYHAFIQPCRIGACVVIELCKAKSWETSVTAARGTCDKTASVPYQRSRDFNEYRNLCSQTL